MLNDIKIGMIGLGYVGLPLAVEFGRHYPTVGFDINKHRISELQSGNDHTLEVSTEELSQATHLTYSANIDDIASCNFYIITVPTPINEHKQPDLTPLEKASDLLGKVIKSGDIVIYESTVYPGATE
jgi:UDP-N-acetyl-D-galactosamine dehydrogenase